MIHVRYCVRYVEPHPDYDCKSARYDPLTWLERQRAQKVAEFYTLAGYPAEVCEFMADFQVPAEVIPFEWVRQ